MSAYIDVVGFDGLSELTNNRTNNQHGLAVGAHKLRHRFHPEVQLLKFNATDHNRRLETEPLSIMHVRHKG